MLQLLEDGDLSDGRGGNALFFVLKPDFLDSYHPISSLPDASIDNTIRALPNALQSVKLQQRCCALLTSHDSWQHQFALFTADNSALFRPGELTLSSNMEGRLLPSQRNPVQRDVHHMWHNSKTQSRDTPITSCKVLTASGQHIFQASLQ